MECVSVLPACSPNASPHRLELSPILQPFRHFKVNPSYLATKGLDGTTLSEAPPPFASTEVTVPDDTVACPAFPPRTILISTETIPLSYTSAEERRSSIHGLQREENPAYDLILHVGVDHPGTCKLEQRGRRHGYVQTDVDEKLAPVARLSGDEKRGFVADEWSNLAQVGPDGEELWSNVNSEVVKDWVTSMGVEHIRTSTDAGEFSGSWATAARQTA